MIQSTVYGYARISSAGQKQDRQIVELIEVGIPEEKIYCDTASGKDFNRPEYQKMKDRLQKGDLLVIKSIDRLGRNYDEILQEWRKITKEIGSNIRVIDIPLLDTTLQNKDLTGLFISDLVLQILSYVAEQERNNIKQRQREGIAIAKAQGKHLGRPKADYPSNFDNVYKDWKNGDLSAKEAMDMLGMKRTTFYKMVNKFRVDSGSDL